MIRIFFPAVFLFLAPVVVAQQRPAAFVLAGGKVLDAAGDRLLDGQRVVIVGNRIKEVSASATEPEGAVPIDLVGLTLIPGLIDLHSHLLLHPYNETVWDDQVLRESLELRTVRAVAAARVTLEAGFTTLRDLGTEGAGFADVGLRDAINLGLVPGPRIFATTKAIVATGCYGPDGFDPRWDIPKGAQVADGVDGVRKAVREQIAAGADWIKVYAEYPRRRGETPTATFSQEELSALVHEARTAGRKVSAHAYTDEGIRRAVLAGVATIEHGHQASSEMLALMKDRGVVLCPTLAAAESVAKYGGWKPGEAEPPRLSDARQMFARALKSGVTIACGSDVGVFTHGENVREIELMVEWGMPPGAALRSSTTVAAKVLDREMELGAVAPGYLADLVALKGNPLVNPSALRQPVLVMKDGRIVLDRR